MQHVEDALLVSCHEEPVVGGGPVMGHVARPVETDHPPEGVGAALGVDGEAGDLGPDPGVEPDESASQTPTGFIGRQVFLVGQGPEDFLINRP